MLKAWVDNIGLLKVRRSWEENMMGILICVHCFLHLNVFDIAFNHSQHPWNNIEHHAAFAAHTSVDT